MIFWDRFYKIKYIYKLWNTLLNFMISIVYRPRFFFNSLPMKCNPIFFLKQRLISYRTYCVCGLIRHPNKWEMHHLLNCLIKIFRFLEVKLDLANIYRSYVIPLPQRIMEVLRTNTEADQITSDFLLRNGIVPVP